jgi:hypothetical protein
LLTVTATAVLVVPTVVAGNTTGLGEKLPNSGAMPVPETAKLCGLPLALSVTVSVALRAPEADGVKVTFSVVLWPGATLMFCAPLGVTPKSEAFVPEIPMFEIFRLAVPLLVMVTVMAGLTVPTS